jgi:hypothetical protein
LMIPSFSIPLDVRLSGLGGGKEGGEGGGG